MIKLTTKELLQMDRSLFSGKVICFATDTVFGVGCIYDEAFPEAESKIYQMKERDPNKPLALLVSSLSQVVGHLVMSQEIALLTNYWPGALTIIFATSDDYFSPIAANYSVGIRIPHCDNALAILDYLGAMATTSVNKSGEPPLNDPILIEKQFGSMIDYLVTDLCASSGASSTVVDVRSTPFKILRQGDIKIN